MIVNATEDTTILRDCPFCGNKVKLYAQKEGWMHSYATAYVHCPTCKARGPRFEASIMSEELKQKAIDGWNE